MKRWKHLLAKWVKWPPMRCVMAYCIRLFVPKQRAGVALVVFNSDDQLLLLKHVFHPASPWGLPGGWLHRNESPADCAKRELWEETGVEAKIGPPVQITYQPSPSHIGIAFLGWADGEPQALSGEILDAKWVELDNLPDSLYPFTRQAIENGYQLHCLLKQSKRNV